MNFDCVVIGDILWDVIVHTNKRKLVYGGADYCNYSGISPGGIGNVATALSKLGAKTALIGIAGNDNLGRDYIRNLEEHNVSIFASFDNKHPTGMAITFISDQKERSFLVFRGANDFLSTGDLEDKEIIKKSKYLLVSGFSLVTHLCVKPYLKLPS